MNELSLSILIADDHPLFRTGVRTVLNKFSFVTNIIEAESGEKVLQLVRSTHIDIILMDIQMSPLNGIETTKLVLEKFPLIKIIALTMFNENWHLNEMIKVGASGYLNKNTCIDEIRDAIQTVIHGENFFLNKDLEVKRNQNSIITFTKKHDQLLKEIAFLIHYNKTSEEIGKILNLTKRTIDTYRLQLNELIGTKSISGVTKYTIETGIAYDPILLAKFSKNINSYKIINI